MSQNLLYIRRYNSNKTMDAIDKDDIDEDEDDDDGRPRHGSNTSGQSARLGNFLTNSRQPMTLITPSHRGSRGSRGVFLSFSINSLTSGNILSTTQFSSSEASRGAIYDDPEDLTPPTPLPPHPFFKAPSKGQGQQKDKKTEREIKMEIEELQAQLDQMKKEKVKLLSEFSGSVYGQDENGESGINSFEGRPSEKGIDHADKVRENEVHAPLKSNDSEIPISKLLKKDSYSSKTEFNQEDFLKHLWCSPSSGAKGSGGVWRDVKENEPEISNKIHQRPKHTPNAIVNSFDGQFKCLDSDSEIMDDGVFENKFPEVDTMQDLEEITLPANPNIPHTRSRKTTGYLYNKHNSFDSSDSIQADVKSNSISHHDDVPGKNPSASETLPEDKSPLVLQENKSHSVLPDSKRPSILPEYKSPSEQSDESFIRPDLPPLKYPEHSPSPESDHITQLPPKKKSQDIPFESSPSQTTEYDDDENTRYQDYNDSNKASYSNATGSSHHNVSRYAGYMSSLQSLADHHGYIIKDVTPDGNCMFSAIIDQLRIQGNFDLTPNSLRKTAVDYLKENPKNQDGTHLESFLSTETWEEYLKRMGQESQWGDHMVLQACTEVTGQKIVVFKPNANKTVLVPTVEKASEDNTVTLGHIGESHFVSLRPKDWEANWPLMAQAHRVKKKEKQKLTKKKILERKKADKLKKISTPESSVRGESTSVDEKELTGTEETEGNTLEVLTDKKPVEEEDDEGDEDEEDDSQFKTTDDDLDLMSDDLVLNPVAIDTISGTPMPHLSFLLRQFVRPSYLYVGISKNVTNFSDNGFETYIAGSVAEGLCVRFIDYSNPHQQVTPATDTTTVIGVSKEFVRSESEVKVNDTDLIADTTLTRPGYVHLVPANPRLHHALITYIEKKPFIQHIMIGTQQKGAVFDMMLSKTFTGYKTVSWPECAMEWFSRSRPSGWPGKGIMQKIMNTECVVMSRHHPNCVWPQIEYQFVFPKAELILAKEALSDDQRHCFNAFKTLIDFSLRNDAVKLGTVHLKSVMYNVCETIPQASWENNSGGCLIYLLDSLCQKLQARNIPNYFIHENNMVDHLDEGSLEMLQDHITIIRTFPIMALYHIMEHHELRLSWMASRVLDDIPLFYRHRRKNRTVREAFVPAVLHLAKLLFYDKKHKDGYAVAQNAYSEFLMQNPEEDENDLTEAIPNKRDADVEFEKILQNMIKGEPRDYQHFLAYHLDIGLGTSLIQDVIGRTDVKTIGDIIGDEAAGRVALLPIPPGIYGHIQKELSFLDDCAYQMFKQGKIKQAVIFLRSGIQKGIREREGSVIDVSDITDSRVKKDIARQTYTVMHSYNALLANMYSHLFACYHYLDTVDQFQDIIEDYEDLCDMTGSPIFYQDVIQIWNKLGNVERSRQAKQKMKALTSSSEFINDTWFVT